MQRRPYNNLMSPFKCEGKHRLHIKRKISRKGKCLESGGKITDHSYMLALCVPRDAIWRKEQMAACAGHINASAPRHVTLSKWRKEKRKSTKKKKKNPARALNITALWRVLLLRLTRAVIFFFLRLFHFFWYKCQFSIKRLFSVRPEGFQGKFAYASTDDVTQPLISIFNK